jgi:ABC-type branched-subunit amino acid transport system ATPase component
MIDRKGDARRFCHAEIKPVCRSHSTGERSFAPAASLTALLHAVPSDAAHPLDRIGLVRHDQKGESMSWDEMQRIAVARALLHRLKIIVADELAASLDAKFLTKGPTSSSVSDRTD